ncbi:MAG TPA: hypothetical protein H9706_02385 [Candidatus Gemmiger stercorigallinarum]|nr:hypothetical protein [Candidatus Gemmiger stercorigallinarum]
MALLLIQTHPVLWRGRAPEKNKIPTSLPCNHTFCNGCRKNFVETGGSGAPPARRPF